MTKLLMSHKTIAASFLMAIGLVAISNSGVQANTTSLLLQCQASAKNKVVSCCERIIRHEKKPLWFTENKMSCSSAAVCSGGKRHQPVTLAEAAPAALALIITPKRRARCYVEMSHGGGQGGEVPTLVTRVRGQ